ncbi:hypothetical protein PGS49_03375 [Yersinia intermedia]|uniref:hypothetical protein n=1 Tax=Yersinia intermedia TaxID=631 RepID=UPI0022FE927A|nr:hypothetical protein [Yersinia intermedia]MDA5479702.1 hypothetical protein [Yersinia intermedia]
MSNPMTEKPDNQSQETYTDDEQWLTAEAFIGKPGMPGTAKGCRLRLEKLAAMHPDIKRKRTGHKGFEYHIRAAGMSLQSERVEQQQKTQPASPYGSDEQLNLWVQLFKTMKAPSRSKLLKLAMEQVADDLALSDREVTPETLLLARRLMALSEEHRKQLLDNI